MPVMQRLMVHLYTLPQEQAAKTSMVSEVRLVLCIVEKCVANTFDHAPMKLEKHYTCWIERRCNKSHFTRLSTGLLVSNA